MKAYRYNPKTKIYVGEVNCQLDPLETKAKKEEVWLLPAHSTLVQPLEEKSGFDVIWNGEAWEYREIPQLEPPHEPTTEEKQELVRATRNYYLAKWDYTQLADAPLTAEEKAKYAEYRQYLRDYPELENWWESDPQTFEQWEKGE